MGGLLLIVGVLVCLVVAAILARDILLRIYDPFSWKHLFLIGFVVFFGTGTVFTVANDVGSDLHVASDRAKGIMAMGLVLFLVVFLVSVRWGMKSAWVDKLVPTLDLPRTTPGVLICTFAALALVIGSLAFPATGESLTAALASYFRGGMAVVATGLATYWLLAQRFNPISWLLLVGTAAICMVASIAGESGRRPLLGVMMVVPWVWYYTVLRYRPVRSWVPKAGLLLAASFVLLVGYSGVRASLRNKERSLSALTNALVQSAQSSDLSGRNLKQDLFYQDAATNSMYIIDTYGEQFEQQPLRGLYWLITNPIPRSWWPAKPVSLSGDISTQQRVIGNIAPGIIGHGWAEAEFIGIAYYAVFFGFIVGAGDRLLQLRASNPFFVVAFGCSLGQAIAMSRGDTPNFFLQSLLTTGMAFGLMYGCKLVFGPIMAAFPQLHAGPRLDAPTEEEGDGGGEPDSGAADDGTWPEDHWGQASAAWEYSEHEAEAEHRA